MKIFEKKANIKNEMKSLLAEMERLDTCSQEYQTALRSLAVLAEAHERVVNKIKLDTLALVAGNLVIALLIINHEQTGIISSKVGQFILKGRV